MGFILIYSILIYMGFSYGIYMGFILIYGIYILDLY